MGTTHVKNHLLNEGGEINGPSDSKILTMHYDGLKTFILTFRKLLA